jgi:hypothetical protein
MSRQVIRQGMAELNEAMVPPAGRLRRVGGGRKTTLSQDDSLRRDLESLVEPTTRGHRVSHSLVGRALHEPGCSLQAGSKTLEGSRHPDRNAQFEYLNRRVKRQLQHREPAISVDTKELVGGFKNGGRELRPSGDPGKVRVHDFIIPEPRRANPCGVCDIANNRGRVSVGVDHDTAAFAVESIRHWWNSIGRAVYPNTGCSHSSAGTGAARFVHRYPKLPSGNQSLRSRSRCHRPPARSVSRRLELHPPPREQTPICLVYFVTRP